MSSDGEQALTCAICKEHIPWYAVPGVDYFTVGDYAAHMDCD